MGGRRASPQAPAFRRRIVAGEALGTFVLVFGGLSSVFALLSPYSPFARLFSDSPWLGRAAAGFIFAAVVTAAIMSPLARLSDAHYNPSVTLAVWLRGGLATNDAALYLMAQLLGGIAGGYGLRLWGPTWIAMGCGMTVPGPGLGAGGLVLTEGAITWAVVAMALVLQTRNIPRPLAAISFPLLFALLTAITGPMTGTSSNLARTLGPALVMGRLEWVGWYGIATALGACCAAVMIAPAAARQSTPPSAMMP